MNDIVIRARDLRKVYRLYSGPIDRFLDMFGLLPNGAGRFTEHAALDGISLDIRRGEKVAFIGRNGAGKSTLLKLITRVIEPTSGGLEVKGHVHALLQIGTGFHPDFTGRDNVFAYLAQLGVTGKEAEQRYGEIVEFAELEEYIGQPVKTYSSGMAVRLMFSTATAITPELLVLDEVLGVGDAYFAQKSYERMRELTDRSGTTLLLVTHDVYSAVKICDRLIWIDRGRVLMDGDGPQVIKAYEDSVRQQEEARLRLRKQHRAQAANGTGVSRVIVEVQALANRPLAAPVYFARIELDNRDGRHSLPLDADAFDERRVDHLQREGTWGDPIEWQGRLSRPLLNYGSPFHKVAGVIGVESGLGNDVRVEVDYFCTEPFAAVVRLFEGTRAMEVGTIEGVPGSWRTWAGTASPAARATAAATINATGIHGTGLITITRAATVNTAGDEVHFYEHGGPFELMVDYRINKPDLAERPQVLIAFHRDGIQDVCRVITRDLFFNAAGGRSGQIRMIIPRLWLGLGNYTITIMLVRPGYFDEDQTVYFSVNPGVYACHSRALEIVVTGSGIVANGTAMVGEAEWSLST